MKQLTLTLAAIATFCCSTLLQAQTLDQFIDLDALIACDCELVLEPVCVDLGMDMTFPAPNACVAECLGLPVVDGGDCMTPEALAFWAAFFGVNPDDLQDLGDLEDLLDDLLEDYLGEGDGWDGDDDDDDEDGDGWDGDGWDGDDDDEDEDGDGWDGDGWDGDDDDEDEDGDGWDGDDDDEDEDGDGWDGDDSWDGGCDNDTLSTDSVSMGGQFWQGWNVEHMHRNRGTHHGGVAFEDRNGMETMAVEVFPNPASEHVMVSVPLWAEEVRLLNMRGQVVHAEQVADRATVTLTVWGQAEGIYHVVILGEGQTSSATIVVNH
jgi:hypothetical protein